MLFGRATKGLFEADEDYTPGDVYDKLNQQDRERRLNCEGQHVERIVKSKGRDLHHDRANMKYNKDY